MFVDLVGVAGCWLAFVGFGWCGLCWLGVGDGLVGRGITRALGKKNSQYLL